MKCVNSTNPWFERGGTYNNGVEAGVFAFGHATGLVNPYMGFRVVF